MECCYVIINDVCTQLQTTNEEGNSTWSNIVCFRTLPDRPQQPSKPQVKGRVTSQCFRCVWGKYYIICHCFQLLMNLPYLRQYIVMNLCAVSHLPLIWCVRIEMHLFNKHWCTMDRELAGAAAVHMHSSDGSTSVWLHWGNLSVVINLCAMSCLPLIWCVRIETPSFLTVMYCGSGSGGHCCICTGQMLSVHSSDGSTSVWLHWGNLLHMTDAVIQTFGNANFAWRLLSPVETVAV